MKSTKSLLSLALLACLLVFLGMNPAESSAKERYEEKFEKTVSLAKDGRAILGNLSGDIEVKTWNRGEVKIEALKVSETDSEEQAKKNFEKVTIEITEEGRTLRIQTKYAKDYFNSRNRNCSVSFWLTIPDEADADINSISGDILMEDIGGAAKAKSVSGEVDLRNISGAVKGNSISGDVTLMDARDGAVCESVSGDIKVQKVTGGVELKSISGEVTAENCEGDVQVEVVNGDVELTDIVGAEKVAVSSLSGEVKYMGSISRDGRYEFKAHSGDVTLVIPGNSAFDLSARTFSGDLESDFEITMSGKLGRKELRGDVNGGGSDLNIKTFSGDVYIKKR